MICLCRVAGLFIWRGENVDGEAVLGVRELETVEVACGGKAETDLGVGVGASPTTDGATELSGVVDLSR